MDIATSEHPHSQGSNFWDSLHIHLPFSKSLPYARLILKSLLTVSSYVTFNHSWRNWYCTLSLTFHILKFDTFGRPWNHFRECSYAHRVILTMTIALTLTFNGVS